MDQAQVLRAPRQKGIPLPMLHIPPVLGYNLPGFGNCPGGWECPHCRICNPEGATKCGNCGR